MIIKRLILILKTIISINILIAAIDDRIITNIQHHQFEPKLLHANAVLRIYHFNKFYIL